MNNFIKETIWSIFAIAVLVSGGLSSVVSYTIYSNVLAAVVLIILTALSYFLILAKAGSISADNPFTE